MTQGRITAGIKPQSHREFDVVILGSDRSLTDPLQGIIEREFPTADLRLAESIAKLKLPPPTDIPLLFLADYRAVKSGGSDFLKRLRKLIKNVWICIVTSEDELVEAFDRLGKLVDDIFQLNDQIAPSLTNSLRRLTNASAADANKHFQFNPNTIHPDLLLEVTHDAFIVADGDGLILYANEIWLDKFPDPGNERTYLSDIIHPNDLHRLEADLQLCIIEKSTGNTVFRIRSQSESWETLQATITGVESEGIHAALISGRIVTELHKMQKRLQELEIQNILFNNFSISIVYRYNYQSQNLEFISGKLLEKTSISRDDFTQSNVHFYDKLIEPSDQSAFRMFLENHVRRGTSTAFGGSIQHRIICKDGSYRLVEHRIELDWSRDASYCWINGELKEVSEQVEASPDRTEIANDSTRLFEVMLEGMAEFEVINNQDDNSIGLKCLSCNDAFVKAVGIPRDRILHSLLSDLFPGLDETPLDIDSEESLPQVLVNVSKGAGPRTIEEYYWPHLRAYMNISVTSIRAGNVSLLLTDVTRRKHAEIRLAALLRGLPDTALYQTGGGVEYISDGISQMLGYPPQIFQSDRNFFVSLIHPDDRDNLKKLQQRWIMKGSPGVLEMEFRVQHKEGHYIWILDRMSKAFTTPDGRQSSQGVMIDISERKNLEAERQIELAEMEALFNTLPDLLFRIDREGKILNYRAGREDLLFVRPEEFLNKSMYEVLPPHIGKLLKDAVEQTFKSHNQVPLNYDLRVPAGKLSFEARVFYISDNIFTVVVRKL